ncbi:hypothetical protein H8689_08435 [Lachnospiraceae bacterium NSJ-29]|uniref:Uncharacterized protein n=1 Tax=Wansuia hejianensis TaxID=2763667 RepID=A0A926F370_9FIRM|nr:hypothetical protein [Wansuia hejianensis]
MSKRYYEENFKKQLGRIARIMKENALVSNYTVAQYKVHNKSCNESDVSNIVDRRFYKRDKLELAVSDLTLCKSRQQMELCMYLGISS